MTKKQATKVADLIVKTLFVNGQGDEAQRLVLTVDTPTPRNLGGWGRLPVRDVIVAALTA